MAWISISCEMASPSPSMKSVGDRGWRGQSREASPDHQDCSELMEGDIRKFYDNFQEQLDYIKLSSRAKKKLQNVLAQLCECLSHSAFRRGEKLSHSAFRRGEKCRELEKACIRIQEDNEDKQKEIQDLQETLTLTSVKQFALTRELLETRSELLFTSDLLRPGGASVDEKVVNHMAVDLQNIIDQIRDLQRDLASREKQCGELRQLNKELKAQNDALFHQMQLGTREALHEKKHFEDEMVSIKLGNTKQIVECLEQMDVIRSALSDGCEAAFKRVHVGAKAFQNQLITERTSTEETTATLSLMSPDFDQTPEAAKSTTLSMSRSVCSGNGALKSEDGLAPNDTPSIHPKRRGPFWLTVARSLPSRTRELFLAANYMRKEGWRC